MELKETLGDEAQSLLAHECGTISRDRLQLPGPAFVDRVLAESDRPPAVLRHLQHQGVEHSAAASFAPNPAYFDPADLGAVAVGATVYFGAPESMRQLQEVREAFAHAHELGRFTVLWAYLHNSAFKKDGVDYHVSADLTGQANHLAATVEADIVKQKQPENNGGVRALGFGRTDDRVYEELTTDHPGVNPGDDGSRPLGPAVSAGSPRLHYLATLISLGCPFLISEPRVEPARGRDFRLCLRGRAPLTGITGRGEGWPYDRCAGT